MPLPFVELNYKERGEARKSFHIVMLRAFDITFSQDEYDFEVWGHWGGC